MKGADGKYHIGGASYRKNIGSRAEVMHGTARKTSGGLLKSQLKYNKHGKNCLTCQKFKREADA